LQEFYAILKDEYDSMDGLLLLGNAGHTCIPVSLSVSSHPAMLRVSLLCSKEEGARGR